MNCALCLDPDSNHTTAQHESAARILCRDFRHIEVADEAERCGECLSAQAEYFEP